MMMMMMMMMEMAERQLAEMEPGPVLRERMVLLRGHSLLLLVLGEVGGRGQGRRRRSLGGRELVL